MARGRFSRIANRAGGLLLALLAAFAGTAPAHADIVSAFKGYKKGDYAQAFQEFLTLAQLGQPLAQFDVASLYHAGRGVPVNDTNAYAWATLAAANGEARGRDLADAIRPKLPAGAELAAASVTREYTDTALRQTLLPDQSGARPQGWPMTPLDPALDCKRTAVHLEVGYPPPNPRAGNVSRRIHAAAGRNAQISPHHPGSSCRDLRGRSQDEPPAQPVLSRACRISSRTVLHALQLHFHP